MAVRLFKQTGRPALRTRKLRNFAVNFAGPQIVGSPSSTSFTAEVASKSC